MKEEKLLYILKFEISICFLKYIALNVKVNGLCFKNKQFTNRLNIILKETM